MGSKMLVMMAVSPVMFATIVAGVVLAAARGRYDRLGDDLRRAGGRPAAGGCGTMTLQTVLLVAAALFGVGLYGAMSQQVVVMVMMGLELMINGVILAAGGVLVVPRPRPDGQVLLLVVIAAMTVEMAMGFAVATLLHRARGADMTDMATDLSAMTRRAAVGAWSLLPAVAGGRWRLRRAPATARPRRSSVGDRGARARAGGRRRARPAAHRRRRSSPAPASAWPSTGSPRSSLPTVAAVTLLVLVFAAGDVHGGRARFHGLMLLFAAAALLTAAATTLPALLLAWEVMGATSYALIGFRWREDHRVAAGPTAFLTTRTADLGLYLAAGAALAGGTGLALADLPDATARLAARVAAGVLVAALGKAAQLPFSFWLSRAMDGPSPVSALLHSAAMVAMGGYLLLRTAPLLEATGWAATTAAWVGALTALVLGAVAVAQNDLKQLLAASTSAQLGFVVLAAGVAAVAAGPRTWSRTPRPRRCCSWPPGPGCRALGTKQLAALRGAARRWPLVGVAAAVGALSLAGVPPLSLWATKDAVLAAALRASPSRSTSSAWPPRRCPRPTPARRSSWSGAAGPATREARYGQPRRRGSRRARRARAGPLLVAPWCRSRPAPPCSACWRCRPLDQRCAGCSAGRAESRRTGSELAVSGALALVVVAVVARPGARGARAAVGACGLAGARARWRTPLVVRPALRLARAAGPLRRPGARPRRRRRRPGRGGRARGRARVDDRGRRRRGRAPSPPAPGGSARWPAGRRPASCTSTTSRPSSRARRGDPPARGGEVSVLSLIVFLPCSRPLALLSARRLGDRVARWLWVAVTVGELALVGVVWAGYDAPGRAPGLRGAGGAGSPAVGSSYHVGVDGLSLPLLAMTAVVFAACAVYALREQRPPAAPAALFLFLRVHLPRAVRRRRPDRVLRLLRPVHRRHVLRHRRLGHGDAARSALKFFLYTFLGSLALLLGFIGLYVAADPHTFDMVQLAAAAPAAGTALGGRPGAGRDPARAGGEDPDRSRSTPGCRPRTPTPRRRLGGAGRGAAEDGHLRLRPDRDADAARAPGGPGRRW